jgi:hypothetical protein
MIATLQAAFAKALAGPVGINILLFFLAALFGQALHGVLKWGRGEAASPAAWFTTNIKATIAALIVNFGLVVAALQLLPIEHMTPWASLLAGMTTGLASDTVNKGARPAWTSEQRAASTTPPPA